ncbi:MAG: ABC transporter ATP-binding protein [Alphaproteobacteria bacterium]|nr:ABC transporter ATP-binding protein [Alphaproteobacteria bacterium]
MDGLPSPGITVDAAGLSFDGRVVFEGLSFRLEGGCWTALLGPSGVGKSSLLRFIAGLPAAGGDIRGSVAAGDGATLSGRVAYMAQRDLLLPWLSVLDNVTLGHRLRGTPLGQQDRHRALHLLDQVGLADSADARPAALSGGMRQRAALARTLWENRPIVLMDEPFSALDALTRFRLQETAAGLLRDRTVFLVTHDPMEALRLADRILVLTGSPASLRETAAPPALPRPRDPGGEAMAARAAALMRDLAGTEGEAA